MPLEPVIQTIALEPEHFLWNESKFPSVQVLSRTVLFFSVSLSLDYQWCERMDNKCSIPNGISVRRYLCHPYPPYSSSFLSGSAWGKVESKLLPRFPEIRLLPVLLSWDGQRPKTAEKLKFYRMSLGTKVLPAS